MQRALICGPALALLVLGAACDPDGPIVGPPCEDDLTECDDDTSQFVEDPTCELSGELELVFGEGEQDFTPIAEGAMPELYTGFQGGQHAWLGVQVQNADLTRPQLKVRISMRFCDLDCDNPVNWQTDVVRELVVNANELDVVDESAWELASILVQVFNWQSSNERGVDMLVTDPCGRQGLIMARES